MDDLIAFAEARLAEEKHRAKGLLFACKDPDKVPDFFGAGGPAAQAYWEHFSPQRMLRDIEAKQRIVFACRLLVANPLLEGAGAPDLGYQVGYSAALEGIVQELAAAWDDHPGYKPGWSPSLR